MKKRIIVYAACIAVTGMYTVGAQTTGKTSAVTEMQAGSVAEMPPPPPVPPVPPVPPAAAEAPLPPAPPIPPLPVVEDADGTSISSLIINENGNEISVHNIRGVETVIVKKGGKEKRIKLSTWLANKKYYNKKYGKLPPPPPPPPPVEEEVKFTPPVIEKDQQ